MIKLQSQSRQEDTGRLGTILDRSAVERLVETCGEGCEEVVAGLLETLFEDSPRLVAALHRGLAEGDAAEVRRAAHTMKSHGTTFGAPFLAHLALEVEELAKQGTLEGAEILAGELEAECERACRALEAVRLELLAASLQPAA